MEAGRHGGAVIVKAVAVWEEGGAAWEGREILVAFHLRN